VDRGGTLSLITSLNSLPIIGSMTDLGFAVAYEFSIHVPLRARVKVFEWSLLRYVLRGPDMPVFFVLRTDIEDDIGLA
jgi:hypothetical protein